MGMQYSDLLFTNEKIREKLLVYESIINERDKEITKLKDQKDRLSNELAYYKQKSSALKEYIEERLTCNNIDKLSALISKFN